MIDVRNAWYDELEQEIRKYEEAKRKEKRKKSVV